MTEDLPDRPIEEEIRPEPLPSAGQVNLDDSTLLISALVVDDLEKVRIANANRLAQLTRAANETDKDGEYRGFGLTEAHPDVARLSAIVDALTRLEEDAIKGLERSMRAHPLGAWVKAQRGIGDKQAARLLATIGDPYMNARTGAPRTPAALWAYCGLHTLADEDDPDAPRSAARRKRGVQSNWSTNAKMRAYLIALSCLKQLVKPCTGLGHVDGCKCSPYRVVYDQRRRATALTHPDWTDGHSHNDALRIASKRILLHLWMASRDLHCPPTENPDDRYKDHYTRNAIRQESES